MTIREAIIKIIEDGQNFEVYSKIGIAKDIDKDLNTCTVEPIDGDAELLDVKLTATEENQSGFLVYPVEGSNVIVTFIDKDTAFVSMVTEVDSIVINGGANGGLVNINPLILELNKNNAILQAIIQGFNTFVPVSNDGGAALKALMIEALAPLQIGDFSDIEDDKIKH